MVVSVFLAVSRTCVAAIVSCPPWHSPPRALLGLLRLPGGLVRSSRAAHFSPCPQGRRWAWLEGGPNQSRWGEQAPCPCLALAGRADPQRGCHSGSASGVLWQPQGHTALWPPPPVLSSQAAVSSARTGGSWSSGFVGKPEASRTQQGAGGLPQALRAHGQLWRVLLLHSGVFPKCSIVFLILRRNFMLRYRVFKCRIVEKSPVIDFCKSCLLSVFTSLTWRAVWVDGRVRPPPGAPEVGGFRPCGPHSGRWRRRPGGLGRALHSPRPSQHLCARLCPRLARLPRDGVCSCQCPCGHSRDSHRWSACFLGG